MKKQAPEKDQVDILADHYAVYHQHSAHQLITYFSIPLILFGIIGLVTAIPFPHLDFLGQYNMFINWFSFLLAATIYYYLRISPLLSYIVLFGIALMYYFIVQLEYVEKAGGLALWQSSLMILTGALLAQIIGYKIEGKTPSFKNQLSFLLWGPIWLFRKGRAKMTKAVNS